jgi:F-type H+-transporting ATPase subunit b
MTIDWLTVTAQIVNFLILVWLLKRFLYKPVINAMAKREARIDNRLSEAQRREQEAEDEAQDYRQRREALEQQRDAALQQAKDDAEQQRQQLLDKARQEIDAQRQQWQEELKQEQQAFIEDLKRHSAFTVANIAGRALTDLADADLERQIIAAFLQRLTDIDDETRQALANDNGALHIHSSFELDDDSRTKISQAVHKALGKERELEFEQSGELICGIELASEGRKLGWNVAQYMDTLENRISASLNGATGAG